MEVLGSSYYKEIIQVPNQVINREMRGFPVMILHVGAVNYSKMPHSEQWGLIEWMLIQHCCTILGKNYSEIG